jgi:hypothetical protein
LQAITSVRQARNASRGVVAFFMAHPFSSNSIVQRRVFNATSFGKI